MKVVVFDLDGTLVDSFEDIAHAANHALKTLGFPTLSIPEVRKHVGRGLENLLRQLAPSAGEPQIKEALRLTREYYDAHPTDYSTVYPGVLEGLDQLGSMGIIRAVLSNKVDFLVQKIALNLGLADRMEEVWGHREGFPLKPDPTSLHAILANHGAGIEDCLMVGDHLPDYELAERTGTHFCAVTYGITPGSEWREKLPNGWVIDSLEELPALLE